MIVQSPCVRNCCLNEADICLGCFRSLEEIICWSRADDEAKTQILTRVAERRSRPQEELGANNKNIDSCT